MAKFYENQPCYQFTFTFVGRGDTVDEAFEDGLDSIGVIESGAFNLDACETELIEEASSDGEEEEDEEEKQGAGDQ